MTTPTALTSTVVRQMAGELSASTSARDRTERVVAVLRESLDVHAAVVYQRHMVSGEAPMVYSCGISPELAQHMTDRRLDADRVAGLEAFINVVAVAGRPRLSDLRGTVYDTLDQLVWSAAFPVSCGTDVVGVLILAWREHVELTPDQLELCETAAALIGVALRQDALIEREAELATLRERARLARDIHDSATQAITASVLNIEAADRALDTDPAAARVALDTAKQLARDTLAELRRSIWNLRSGLLQERSFADALEKDRPAFAFGWHSMHGRSARRDSHHSGRDGRGGYLHRAGGCEQRAPPLRREERRNRPRRDAFERRRQRDRHREGHGRTRVGRFVRARRHGGTGALGRGQPARFELSRCTAPGWRLTFLMATSQTEERVAPRIRVLVCDDHVIVREGLKRLIETAGDIVVAGEAGSGEEAVETVSRVHPDVVLMDIRLPGMDGVAATAAIREKFPSTRILALSTFVDDDLIFGALRAGAHGYLAKDVEPERLFDAIRSVAASKSVEVER